MKVVQINCVSYGSTGHIARAIHQKAQSEGIESWVMYGVGPEAEHGCVQISNQLDYRFHTYFGRLTGLHGYYSKGVTKNLLRELDEINPDIVHMHNLHGDYINIGLLFDWLKSRNQTCVFTLHDCWLFTGGCAHFTMAKCHRWLDSCGKCCQQNVYPKSYLFDTSRKCLKDKKEWFNGLNDVHITTVSQWLGLEAKKSYLGRYPVETIYNGIDTNVFQPIKSNVREKYGIPHASIMVLGVSSIWNDKRKGLNQFAALREILPSEYCIVLVGPNEEQKKSMPNGVICISRTENQKELAELYSTADVFINVSPEETFGLVTAEALACGTPAIVSTETACPEVIEQKSGIAIDTLDIKKLSDSVQRICSANFKYIHRNDCIKRITENFTLKKMTDEYIALYKGIMMRGNK